MERNANDYRQIHRYLSVIILIIIVGMSFLALRTMEKRVFTSVVDRVTGTPASLHTLP